MPDSTDRIIGELREFKGELREFKRVAIGDLADMKNRLTSIEKFHWRVIGFCSAISVIIAVTCEGVHSMFH